MRALPWLAAAGLLIAGFQDPSLAHIVVERDQPARMRDGVTLYADVYRPDRAGRFPALLMRTPYNKEGATQSARLPMTIAAVRRGYVVVVQDTRGQFRSEGRFDPYRQEITDGYDTIEWAARLPWVDGTVGTFGLSYPGAVQWMTAPTRPPSLKAMAPAMTFANANHFVYHGGIFEADFIEWLLGRQTRERRERKLPFTTPEEIADGWKRDGQVWMDHRPLRDLPLMRGFEYWREWIDNPIEAEYWKPYDIEAQHRTVTVPALNLSGWNDDPYGPPGAIRNFAGMRARGGSEAAREGQRLVMGPWTHGVPSNSRTTYAGVDFGPNAAIDFVEWQLRFFDYWLKGIDNGYSREPPVRYFVMGENRWREAPDWPPPGVTTTEFPLSPKSFQYDPKRPVLPEWRTLATTPGVATFTGEPLRQPMEITGQVLARLWISADVPDTDVTVRLLAVAPDGQPRPLTNAYGSLRASYRTTEEVRAPRPLTPGQPAELTINVGYTSVLVPRGDRLQVVVAGSMRQGLQTHDRAARVQIHHDGTRNSRILIPVHAR